MPNSFAEVEGKVWDCLKCNLLCGAAIGICSAVCLFPEPDQPFLCAVRDQLSYCSALAYGCNLERLLMFFADTLWAGVPCGGGRRSRLC